VSNGAFNNQGTTPLSLFQSNASNNTVINNLSASATYNNDDRNNFNARSPNIVDKNNISYNNINTP
jgi:hypothetical protein